MDAYLRSRFIDGLNYYKYGDLTLEETLNGFEKLLEMMEKTFEAELTELINKHSKENERNNLCV